MDANALWAESYQGEVLGEALFGLLAERQPDAGRRAQLEVLQLLERATKELAEPVLERRLIDRGDTASSVAAASAIADGVADMDWTDFLGSFDPVISQYLDRYRALVDLAEDDLERRTAEAFVAHEQALASFIRCSLGTEEGEPLRAILELPHVSAAAV